jgi:laminin B (domain IV)
VVGLVLLSTGAAFADSHVIVSSTFDTDADGWVAKDLAFPNPGVPPVPLNTFTPVYQPTGGNPGGHLSLADPTANAWYWYAPAKFLGDRHAAYGGTLSFDLAVTGTGTPFDEEDVILVGGGVTLVFTLPARPGTSFTSYQATLTEAGWKRDTRSGPAATLADMQTVLGALTYIRGEYLLASDDVGRIDNVVIAAAPRAQCDVQLNKTSLVNGDTLSAPVFRFVNLTASPLAIEFKVWLEVPGVAPIVFTRGGENGAVVLPASFSQNLGPISLFTISAGFPRGQYAVSCRILDPVTGLLQSEDLNAFEIH